MIVLMLYLDPFGEPERSLESLFEKKPAKKIKQATDSFLSSALHLDNKNSPPNEISPLKRLIKSHEGEKKAPESSANKPVQGQHHHHNDNLSKPKPPSYIQPSANQTFNLGAGLDAGSYDMNKLKFLPHVQCKESRYGNNVVPVLPSFFAEDK